MTKLRSAFARHAWVVFFVLGVGAVAAGIVIVAGVLPNPPSAETTTGITLEQIVARVPGIGSYLTGLSRQLGNFMIAMGVLTMAIAAIPFRNRQRWAWYAFWILPVNLVLQLANSLATGGFLWQLDFATLVALLAALLVSYRGFFPAPT